MSDETQNVGGGTGDGGNIGWKTELPEALRSHEAFAPYKSKIELWEGVTKLHTDYKATAQKATDLEKKIENYIPRLPENASEDDKAVFYKALGRPDKPEEYELDGEDKNATEWTKMWKDNFHKLGIPKEQAKELSKTWNGVLQNLVEQHNASIQKEIQTSSEKLKTELGDKYEAGVELAKRMWTKHSEGFPEEAKDFDKAFTGESSPARYAMMRFLLNIAKLTGEDSSLKGAVGNPKAKGGFDAFFPNSPPSPTGK